jgi:hypothetical protein
MTDDETINTVFVDEVTQMTTRGEVEAIKRVRFRVGNHGPFSLYFKEAEFTRENLQARMEAQAAVVRGLP